MSISLPNGTILSTPSAPPVSAAVTRILHLANFSAELKTRDLQLIFKDWEGEKGGFRIKWVDDVNALVVFNDATVAKRAYLHLLLNPPVSFPPPAQIRPYDRPDAAAIIAQLTARAMGHRSSASAMHSISGGLGNEAPGGGPITTHTRGQSFSQNNTNGNGSTGGMNGFVMPTKRHARTGSASASWARTSMGGGGGGVLNFPSSNSGRLPTHSESSADPSRVSSSSEDDPVVIMDGKSGRRDSLSAEKALREVQKALSGVPA